MKYFNSYSIKFYLYMFCFVIFAPSNLNGTFQIPDRRQLKLCQEMVSCPRFVLAEYNYNVNTRIDSVRADRLR